MFAHVGAETKTKINNTNLQAYIPHRMVITGKRISSSCWLQIGAMARLLNSRVARPSFCVGGGFSHCLQK